VNLPDARPLPAPLTAAVNARPVVSQLPDRRWRFEFAVRERESKSKITQPASLEQLMREQGLRPEDFLVENSMVYSYEAKIASHWRKDKIFLLGDAAHYQPGITGSGLCHSMRDAINLCWKLAYVIKGKASPSLLEVREQQHGNTASVRESRPECGHAGERTGGYWASL
jgi:3-(3-hydroxy-phenyl)propionate hydroxylase